MNRETFELDENETAMSLKGFTQFEKSIIIVGLNKLLNKRGLLKKCTPICDAKTGSPVIIVLEWKYNRDIMKNLYNINDLVEKSVNEVSKDLFKKSFII